MKNIFSERADNIGLSWRNDIWPYQWRIAISSCAGYFMFNMFNPIIFRSFGAGEAGRFGLTWGLLLSVSSVANAWNATKVQRYCSLINLNERSSLNNEWRRNSILSFIICFLGVAGLLASIKLAEIYRPENAARALGFVQVLYLIPAILIYNVVNSFAYYLRAHRREPFMNYSVITAIVVVAIALLAPHLGIALFLVGVSLGAFITFPYACWIFRINFKMWSLSR